MKRLFSAIFVIIILCNPNFAQSRSVINDIIKNAQKSEKLNQAQWSLKACYIESGKTVINYNSKQNLSPASGLKLFTTAAALDILGENYKFITKLYYDGELGRDGILNGNVYIRGGSDPTLGSDLVKGSLPLDSLMKVFTEKIKAAGIKIINGSVIADPTRFQGMNLPRRWIWEDIGNYYGAQTSGLCIHDNLYKIFFEPNPVAGRAAKLLRIEPVIPGLQFVNNMRTGEVGSGDNGYVFCPPNYYTAELTGTIPKGKSEFEIKGSIPDPALFAAQYLTDKLKSFGIKVNQDAKVTDSLQNYTEMEFIAEHFSPPLKDIVYIINKKSYNLYTEQLLREMGLNVYGKGTIENGLKFIEEYLERNQISTKGFNIYDGSGLSRSNIITTEMMVELLKIVSKKSYFDSFYNSLGIAGDPDDLNSLKSFGVGSPIANNARIKSGYMSGVRSHSGYVRDQKGKLIAFSFIANNFIGNTSFISKTHKEILIALAKMK